MLPSGVTTRPYAGFALAEWIGVMCSQSGVRGRRISHLHDPGLSDMLFSRFARRQDHRDPDLPKKVECAGLATYATDCYDGVAGFFEAAK